MRVSDMYIRLDTALERTKYSKERICLTVKVASYGSYESYWDGYILGPSYMSYEHYIRYHSKALII